MKISMYSEVASNILFSTSTMDPLFLSLSLTLTITALALTLFYLRRRSSGGSTNLPPGNFGWPFIGESIEFLYGKPEKFVADRMKKHSPHIFKTKILGEKTAVICGPAGNKFLFSNEQKLVVAWRPHSMQKLYRTSSQKNPPPPSVPPRGNETEVLRSPGFLKPQSLMRYMPKLDSLAHQHLDKYWHGQDTVKVYPLAATFTLSVASNFFLGLEDHEQGRVTRLVKEFNDLTFGQHAMAVDFPGTMFSRARAAAATVTEEFRSIIKERKEELLGGGTRNDILSHMILAGRAIPESEIASNVMGIITAGYNAVAMTITFLLKYIGERPDIYTKILAEQQEIAASKIATETLNWDEIQKMKYSWNVACEVMRLMPPLQGTFREAITDFTYEGFTIPKGWKIYWTVSSTNKNPDYFSEPEKFDPTRYEEGNGCVPYTYVPFGGGPRMCPGKEYARLAILTFLHNVVKKFKWEIIIPNEKIMGEMMPIPAQGLPVRLQSL